MARDTNELFLGKEERGEMISVEGYVGMYDGIPFKKINLPKTRKRMLINFLLRSFQN